MKREKVISYSVTVEDIEEALRAYIMQQESDPRICEHIRTATIGLDWEDAGNGTIKNLCLGVDGAIADSTPIEEPKPNPNDFPSRKPHT